MSEALTKRQALLILNALQGIGPITLNKLLESMNGDPCAVLSSGRRELESVEGLSAKALDALLNWRSRFDLAREEERLAHSGATFVTQEDPYYPPMLREIHDPPIGLYRLGQYGFEDPCVAIVGSRKTTLYGQSVAKRFGEELARAGFCVVSGLARGIDTAAHEGALAGGGRTAAVLGVGIDIIYPPENLDLYRRIAQTGAVLSEFPFGRHADTQSFAMRNRLVSGICKAVVVVESAVSGGSMITARFAGEQGRMLCAVPGRIDQAGSGGCHQLIRDGATLVTSIDDILQEMNYLRRTDAQEGTTSKNNGPALPPEEQAVFDCFAGGALLSVDDIAQQLQQAPPVVGATLMMLEIKHLIVKRADGTYEAR